MNFEQSVCCLFESVLLEYSSTIALLRDKRGQLAPGAQALSRWVSDELGIHHNVEWTSSASTDLVKPNLFSRLTPIGAILLKGSSGVAWIVKQGAGFKISFSNDQSAKVQTDKGRWAPNADTRNFIKQQIGDIQQAWITKDLGKTAVTKLKRKRTTTRGKLKPEQILLRLKPLWNKILTQAVADLRGYTQHLVKNNSYDHAVQKLYMTRQLHNIQLALERGESEAVMRDWREPLVAAVNLAAAHHYPELSANWLDQGNPMLYDTDTNRKAVDQLLQDLSQGKYQLLGSVLGYLKQQLLKRV
jgi:hypothetical protein